MAETQNPVADILRLSVKKTGVKKPAALRVTISLRGLTSEVLHRKHRMWGLFVLFSRCCSWNGHWR